MINVNRLNDLTFRSVLSKQILEMKFTYHALRAHDQHCERSRTAVRVWKRCELLRVEGRMVGFSGRFP